MSAAKSAGGTFKAKSGIRSPPVGPGFEYVESDANWSDGVSRFGVSDDWAVRHAFSILSMDVPAFIWRLPLPLVLRVLRFL